MLKEITAQAHAAMQQLLATAKLRPGDIVVVGCSTSEIAGHAIGSTPGPDIAAALLEGFLPLLSQQGLFLAAQCCEHLERALVVEEKAMQAHRLTRVNAIPQPKAGGSFATAAFDVLPGAVLVRRVRAAAGLDIGSTLIGMHLQEVAVPVRLAQSHIGKAALAAARTRPRFVGGARAVYDENLM